MTKKSYNRKVIEQWLKTNNINIKWLYIVRHGIGTEDIFNLWDGLIRADDKVIYFQVYHKNVRSRLLKKKEIYKEFYQSTQPFERAVFLSFHTKDGKLVIEDESKLILNKMATR